MRKTYEAPTTFVAYFQSPDVIASSIDLTDDSFGIQVVDLSLFG